MYLLTLILFLSGNCDRTPSYEEILVSLEYEYQETETFGTIAQRFYGHENLWSLVYNENLIKNNNKTMWNLQEQTINQSTKPSQVWSADQKLIIPPGSKCVKYMNESCLQALDYIFKINEEILTPSENDLICIKNKLNLTKDDNLQVVSDLTSFSDQKRLLFLPPAYIAAAETIILIVQIITSTQDFIDNLKIAVSEAPIKKLVMLQIINDTPDTLGNFKPFLVNGIWHYLPFEITPFETDYFFASDYYRDNTFDNNRPAIIDASGYLQFDFLYSSTKKFLFGYDYAKSDHTLKIKICINQPTPWNILEIVPNYQTFLTWLDNNQPNCQTFGKDNYKGWFYIDLDEKYAVKIFYPEAIENINIQVIAHFIRKSDSLPRDALFKLAAFMSPSIYMNPSLSTFLVSDPMTFEWQFLTPPYGTGTGSSDYHYLIRNQRTGCYLMALSQRSLSCGSMITNTNMNYGTYLWNIQNMDDRWQENIVIKNKFFPQSSLGLTTDFTAWTLHHQEEEDNDVLDHFRFILNPSRNFTTTVLGNGLRQIIRPLYLRSVVLTFTEEVPVQMQVTLLTPTNPITMINFKNCSDLSNQVSCLLVTTTGNSIQIKPSNLALVIAPQISDPDQLNYQKWIIIPNQNFFGLYSIKNQESGCYLTAPDSSVQGLPWHCDEEILYYEHNAYLQAFYIRL